MDLPLVHLSTFSLIAVNAGGWALIHLGVGFLASRIADDSFDPRDKLFRTRVWERNGEIYQSVFRVRLWKKFLPSGGKIFGLFSLNRFRSSAGNYTRKWIVESCRAELTHWSAMLPALSFLLWNPFEAWLINLIYAICANIPCIISQRYNRPRIQALVGRREAASNSSSCPRAGLSEKKSAG